MSSMRPLRYFVVTWSSQLSYLKYQFKNRVGTYSIVFLVKVIHISVENLNKKFNRHRGIHASVCNTKCSL